MNVPRVSAAPAPAKSALGEKTLSPGESALAHPETVPRRIGLLATFDHWLARKLLAKSGNPPLKIVLPDGGEIQSSNTTCVGSVVIRERSTLWRLLLNPSLTLGDAYRDGCLEIEGDLLECLETLFRSLQTAPRTVMTAWLLRQLQTHDRRPTRSASRQSVHHHYDIGNDFYKLWLDERMVYTCGYFAQRSDTLEQAQLAKMDHVCRKLRLRPGDSVVEAGCGWGALALHMAQHYGAKVRAFNLSREQIAYARERARAAGFLNSVEFIEDDYRNISGRYDAFVSVGMLEHVGLKNYPELGRIIDCSLTPTGRGLIHSIGRNRPAPIDPWTERRIFPGAYPPSLREMLSVFELPNFSVLDVENLRLHYALTLEHWLKRYEDAFEAVVRMFDMRFARAWRFYLACSAVTFLVGDLQLFQILFTRAGNNTLPWTRADLYPA